MRVTQNQRRVISDLRGTIVCVKSSAGGGKTTLLLILTLFFCRRCGSNSFSPWLPLQSPPVLFLCQPPNRLSKISLLLWRDLHTEAVAMLGIDIDEGDLFQARLEEACDRMFAKYKPMYDKLDAMLAKLYHWFENSVAPVLAEPGTYLQLARALLQWRGFHLVTKIYDEVMQTKREAVEKLDFMAMTTSCCTKLLANDMNWARGLKERRKLALFMLDFGAVLLSGDDRQIRKQTPQQLTRAVSLSETSSEAAGGQPLEWPPSVSWVSENDYIQQVTNVETFRHGHECLSLLKQVFPSWLDECQSAAEHQTHVFPVVFGDVRDWQINEQHECRASLTVFGSIALILVAELALHFQAPVLPISREELLHLWSSQLFCCPSWTHWKHIWRRCCLIFSSWCSGSLACAASLSHRLPTLSTLGIFVVQKR